MACEDSITGAYAAAASSSPAQAAGPTGWLKVVGARANNLKNLDVSFPLGVFCAVSGVRQRQGSLVNQILYRRWRGT